MNDQHILTVYDFLIIILSYIRHKFYQYIQFNFKSINVLLIDSTEDIISLRNNETCLDYLCCAFP